MARTIRREAASKWQQTVHDRIEAMGLSTRTLASAISTPGRSIANTTVWAWLRSTSGAPGPDIYTPELNRALAKALGVTEQTLADAWDRSRSRFEHRNSDAEIRRITMLRRIFAESARESWTKQEILSIIDDMIAI